MKKLKLLLIISISFFCVGCSNKEQNLDTIYYTLNINTILEEKITVYLDKDAKEKAKQNQEDEESVTNLEYTLLYEKSKPIFSNNEVYYNKNIDKKLNKFKVDLKYNYIEEDFTYSNYIMNCFENYDIKRNEGSLEIHLSGKFYCLHDKKNVNISVNSIFDVDSSNGTLEDDVYTWNINEENVNNVDIKHVLLRNYDGMETERENTEIDDNSGISTGNVIRIVVGGILLVGIFILRKRNLNNDY